MSWAIPATTVYSFRRGNKGIGVWALQAAIRLVTAVPIAVDGDFGPTTEEAVKRFQTSANILADGIAGPSTQRELSHRITAAQEGKSHTPAGLLRGFAEGEGGDLLAAVNHSKPGGVDCGLFQRRVYSADYGDAVVIERAFNAGYQASLLANSLLDLRVSFSDRAGTKDGTLPVTEKAWRLAALNHNYPGGADRLSQTPIKQLSSYWTTPQTWVTEVGYKFPDGAPVRTPLEWCHMYAGVLGRAHGTSGSVTRHVTNW